MFYNFAIEYNDPDFLRRFIPTIERTIQCVDNDVDKEGLGELLEYVQCLLKGKNYEYR
jgi:hypothetical protein